MFFIETKYEFYNKLKSILAQKGFLLTPYQESKNKLTFQIQYQEEFETISVVEHDDKIQLDFSEIINHKITDIIEHVLVASDELIHSSTNKKIETENKKPIPNQIKELYADPTELMGITEAGAEDYFGPLIVSAVHINRATKNEMELLGIDKAINNEKTLSRLAQKIKDTCPHSVLILSCKSFNEIFEKMKNIYHILAWGHSRVIENVLTQTPCKHAISTQSNNASLINGALMAKGQSISLSKANSTNLHIAVKAAKILAEDALNESIQKMNEAFNMTFPPGFSNIAIETKKTFVNKYGSESLQYVVKNFN
jgi:ribonuclease HIII